jgi:hypothetical protein
MPLAWRLFDRRHTALDMIAFVEAALEHHGKPRHLIVDQDTAFTAHYFWNPGSPTTPSTDLTKGSAAPLRPRSSTRPSPLTCAP